jgi:hypothetical protein
VKVYSHPLSATADRLHGGVDNYLERMSAHKETAEQLRSERNTPEGVVWQNANELRRYAHELELSDYAWRSAQDCMRYAHKAQKKLFQHTCLCSVRSEPVAPVGVVLSLAQVASVYERHTEHRERPPGRSCVRSVLSTCHASNAPGALSHVRTKTQESSP